MILRNCYYLFDSLYYFNSNNPYSDPYWGITSGNNYCDISSHLKCDFQCNNFCFYNDITKQKSCKEVDFQKLKQANCDTIFMCNGTENSFQYLTNALNICKQCDPKSNKNTLSTSTMIKQSTQLLIPSSSSNLFTPTSSFPIIKTTYDSESISNTKNDLTSSVITQLQIIPTTYYNEELSSTKTDLTSSLLKPAATVSTTVIIDNLHLPQLQKNKEEKSNANILIPVLSVICSLFVVLITALILFKYCCKKSSSLSNLVTE